jgi:peptidoglycan hydrolase CwlO-like protein
VRNLDELNRLLAEAEEALAKLNARRSKLLKLIAELKQQKALHEQEIPLQTVALPSVTNQSPQKQKLAFSTACFEDVYPKRSGPLT